MKLARFIGGHSRSAQGLCTSRRKAGAEVLGYPPPRVFCEKRLQTIENKGRERGKERRERCKRLQAAENMGFARETRRHRGPEQAEATPLPRFSVSADSKGVTAGVSVSADSKGVICTKMVQSARFRGK